MQYGYARISDRSQNIHSQIDDLLAFGIPKENIVEEIITGIAPKKDKLDDLVEKLTSGDELVVTRFERFGRNTLQLLTLLETLEEKNVRVRIVYMPTLDTRGPSGKMVTTILSGLAEMERSILKEKQRKGIEAARKRGKHLGRKATGYTKAGMEKAIEKYLKGESVNAICEEYNIPKSSFYTKIREAGIKR